MATLRSDWIISSNSTVSATNDRDLFIDYHPFKTHVFDITRGKIDVEGVGKIHLRVRSTECRGNESWEDAFLENVLFIPTTYFNIIGSCHMESIQFDENLVEIKSREQTFTAWFAPWNSLPSLVTEVRPGHFLTPGMNAVCTLSIHWKPEEESRWDRYAENLDVPPYTAEEVLWLEYHFGGEAEFLPLHGLKLTSESERKLGRHCARASIQEHKCVGRFDEIYSTTELAHRTRSPA